MQQRGGFHSNIFNDQKISEIYRCRICTDVCRSPVTCQSGAHLFCLCLSESIRRNPSCPVCRERLTDPLPSAFVAAQVSSLDVVCLHDKCRWKGTCGRLDGHLDIDCPHEPVKCSGDGGCGTLVPRGEMSEHQWSACLQTCPNAKRQADESKLEMGTCNVRMSRKDMDNHLTNECKLRVVHCPHQGCYVSIAYGHLTAHLETCPHAPVSCPLHCGAPKLTRRSLGAHKTDCPNEPVQCVHAPLGCSYVAARGKIGKHEEDTGLHFLSLSKAFVEQQKMLQAILQQLEPLALAKAVENGKAQAQAIEAQAIAMASRVQNRVRALDLRSCYFCDEPIVLLFMNKREPQRDDPKCRSGISGTCAFHTSMGHSTWSKLLWDH